ncbi:MAG: phosphatidate cytidylyltransferase [Opitutae bacterium]|nr:phosphatidate cytidylyltransferase [Opitutae bacterium]
MLSRICSTLILWTVVLGGLWLFGAHAAVVLVALLATLTLHEFYGITAKMGLHAFRWMGLGFSVLMTAGAYYLAWYTDGIEVIGPVSTGLLVLALIVCCIRVLGERDPSSRIETIAATMLGLLCIPFMLQFLLRLLLGESGGGDNLVLCLWVVAVAKFCDVGALLTGLPFGRHKLAPHISPKKSWEGAAGGVLVSAGVGAAIAHFAAGRLPEMLTPAAAAIIAVPLAVVTIISDLMESALKRRADVKDAGTLIPGIGGAFDLTDSLILTAPVAYFIFLFLE